MKCLLSIPLLFAIILICGLKLSACSCVYIPTHSFDFRRSEAVFIGEAIEIEPKSAVRGKWEDEDAYGPAVTFRIDKRWKGPKSSEFTAWAWGFAGSPCGFMPEKGKKYLVYARKFKGGFIFDATCSRSRPIEFGNGDSPDELKELKELDGFWFKFWSQFAYFNFR